MMEAAEADLAAPEPAGRVAISAFPTAAVAFAPALTRTVRAHPGLSLLLRQTAGREVLRQVKAGQVDVAIVDDWAGRLAERQPALRFFPLMTDPLVLVVPRGHWASDMRVPISMPGCATSRGSPLQPARHPVSRSTRCWPRPAE